MAKVAQLYHERGLRQSEIVERLDLSQPTVSRLLKRAQEEQIGRIIVRAPYGTHPELEADLESAFGLKEVIVVDVPRENEDAITRSLGAAAAFFLETTLKRGEVVGISSWSTTLLAMVDAMRDVGKLTDVRVVQILGGVGQPGAEVHAARLTKRLADLVAGKAVFLPAPGVTGSSDARDVLLQDPYVRDTVQLFSGVTTALVGVGALEPSRLLAESGNVFSSDELKLLRSRGAVGDICLRFFDRNGRPVRSVLNDRVVGMELEQLSKVPRSVGIAGGKRKFRAILGALNGRWINVLITDRFCAERLLKERKK